MLIHSYSLPIPHPHPGVEPAQCNVIPSQAALSLDEEHFPIHKDLFFPTDNPYDAFLETFIKKGILNHAFWLEERYTKISLPKLSIVLRNKVLDFLNTPMDFVMPSNTNPSSSFTITTSLKELQNLVLNECKTIGISCTRLEFVGGAVPWILGPDYFEQILQMLWQDDSITLSAEQIEALMRKPPDIDIRAWIYSKADGNENLLFEKLIDYFLTKIPAGNLSIASLRQQIKKHIFTHIDTIFFQDKDGKEGGITHYFMMDFAPTSAMVLEWLFVNRLSRESLFVVQDLRLPIFQLLSDEPAFIEPTGEFCAGLQAIVDRLGRILHVLHPENVNEKGWFSFCWFITQQYRCPESNIQSILRSTALKASYRSNDPIATLAHLLKKWIKKHDETNLLGRSAFLCMISLSLLDVMQDVEIKKLWSLLEIFLTDKNEKLVIEPAGFFQLMADAMKTERINFSLLAALIEITGLHALNAPWKPQSESATYYLTKHDDKPTIQFISQGHSLLLPFSLQQTLQTLETELIRLHQEDRQKVLTLLDTFTKKIRPAFNLELERCSPIKHWAHALNLHLPTLKEAAVRFMESQLPLLQSIGFDLLLGIHETLPDNLNLIILIEKTPDAFASAKSSHDREMLLCWMEKFLSLQKGTLKEIRDIIHTIDKNQSLQNSDGSLSLHAHLNMRNTWIKALATTKNMQWIDIAIRGWAENPLKQNLAGQFKLAKTLIQILLPEQSDRALKIAKTLCERELPNTEVEESLFDCFVQTLRQRKHNAQRYGDARALYSWALALVQKEAKGKSKEGVRWILEEHLVHGDFSETNTLLQAGIEKQVFDEKDREACQSNFFTYQDTQLTAGSLKQLMSDLELQTIFRLNHDQQIIIYFRILKKLLKQNDFNACIDMLIKITQLPPGLTSVQSTQAKSAAYALANKLCHIAAEPCHLELLLKVLELFDHDLGRFQGLQIQKVLSLFLPKVEIWKENTAFRESAFLMFSIACKWLLVDYEDLANEWRDTFANLLAKLLPDLSGSPADKQIRETLKLHIPSLIRLYETIKRPQDLCCILAILLEQQESIPKDEASLNLIFSFLKKCLEGDVVKNIMKDLESIHDNLCHANAMQKCKENKDTLLLPYLFADACFHLGFLEKGVLWTKQCKEKFSCEQRQFQRELFVKKTTWANTLFNSKHFPDAIGLFKELSKEEPACNHEILQKMEKIPKVFLQDQAEFCFRLLIDDSKTRHRRLSINASTLEFARHIAWFFAEGSQKIELIHFVKLIEQYPLTDENTWLYLLNETEKSSDEKIKIRVWNLWNTIAPTSALKNYSPTSAALCWRRSLAIYATLPKDPKRHCTELIETSTPLILELFSSPAVEDDDKCDLLHHLLPFVESVHKTLMEGIISLVDDKINYNILRLIMSFKEPNSFLNNGKRILTLLETSTETVLPSEMIQHISSYIRNRHILHPHQQTEWFCYTLNILNKIQNSFRFKEYPFLLIGSLIETEFPILFSKAVQITLICSKQKTSLPDDSTQVAAILRALIFNSLTDNEMSKEEEALQILTSPVFEKLFSEEYKGQIWGAITLKYIQTALNPKEKNNAKDVLDFYFTRFKEIAIAGETSALCMKGVLQLIAVNQLEEFYFPLFKGHYQSAKLEFVVHYQLIQQLMFLSTSSASRDAKLRKRSTELLNFLIDKHTSEHIGIIELLHNFIVKAYKDLAPESEWMIPDARSLVEKAYQKGILQQHPKYHIPYIYLMNLRGHTSLPNYDPEMKKLAIRELISDLFVESTGKSLCYAIQVVLSTQNILFREIDKVLLNIYDMINTHFIKHPSTYIDDKPAWEFIGMMLEGKASHLEPKSEAKATFTHCYLNWLNSMIAVLNKKIAASDEQLMQWDLAQYFLEACHFMCSKELNQKEYENFLLILQNYVGILPETMPLNTKNLKTTAEALYELIAWMPVQKLRGPSRDKRSQTMTTWLLNLIKTKRIDTLAIAREHLTKAVKSTQNSFYPGLNYFDLLEQIIEVFCGTLNEEANQQEWDSADNALNSLGGCIYTLIKEAEPSIMNLPDYRKRRASTMTLWVRKLKESQNAQAFLMAADHLTRTRNETKPPIYEGESASLKEAFDVIFVKSTELPMLIGRFFSTNSNSAN